MDVRQPCSLQAVVENNALRFYLKKMEQRQSELGIPESPERLMEALQSICTDGLGRPSPLLP
jgi:hypothetical protein